MFFIDLEKAKKLLRNQKGFKNHKNYYYYWLLIVGTFVFFINQYTFFSSPKLKIFKTKVTVYLNWLPCYNVSYTLWIINNFLSSLP